MQWALFDDGDDFFPLTFTRPVWDLRVGILTLREKWQKELPQICAVAHDRLKELFDRPPPPGDCVFVSGRCFPDAEFVRRLKNDLAPGEGWVDEEGKTLAFRAQSFPADFRPATYPNVYRLRQIADIFLFNGKEIVADLGRLNIRGAAGDPHTIVYAPENVYIHPTAKIKAAILDAETGPIYVGPNVQIQIGAMIQGPAAFCEGSVANVGVKIRPETTVGPYCKVGGEISNSVLWGYSNKAHDGFLGNSVLGAWCNLGADTNVSNLKNNYSTVRVRHVASGQDRDTGLQFCGLTMGDHSKSGINTMFNTGTVVGVSSNVFGAGFPPKYIPSFAWGENEVYDVEKAIAVARRVYARRNAVFGPADERLFRAVFEAERQ